MPLPESDLHGNVPDAAETCLVIIDMINAFTFDDAEKLFPAVVQAADWIARLKQRAAAARVPVIYVNDNFGKWRSDFRQVVARCGAPNSRGRDIVRVIEPGAEDHFILKPRHSAFFQTALDSLLKYLRVKRVILAGIAIDACVQFTANDAYLRQIDLWIPADCVAGISKKVERQSLEYFSRVLSADTRLSTGKLD